ncbi:MAG: hypothetical protein ABIO57_03080 [Candidatus Paceibacterota bacterium]
MSGIDFYNDINVEKLLDEKLGNNDFDRINMAHWIKDLEKTAINKYSAEYIKNLKKISEGVEQGYIWDSGFFKVLVWPSYMPSKQRFKKKDRLWVLILDPRNPDPFFAIPMNRIGDFIERLVETARVYKEKVLHWPSCPACKKKFFWQEIFSYSENEQEVANEQFPLRYLVCGNKKCHKHYEKSTMFVADIELPSKKDMDFFALPFKRYARRRAKDIRNNILTLSRRLWRWMNRQGIVVHRRRAYNDLHQELLAKHKGYPDYLDLQHENFPGIHLDESSS